MQLAQTSNKTKQFGAKNLQTQSRKAWIRSNKVNADQFGRWISSFQNSYDRDRNILFAAKTLTKLTL